MLSNFQLKLKKITKFIVVLFMVLTMVNVFLPDLFVISVEESELTSDYRPQAFVRWFNAVSFLILPIAAYFNKDTFKKIAVYFCLPAAILYLCFFGEILSYMTSELGRGIYQIRFLSQEVKNFMINPYFRGTLFITTSLMQLLTIFLLILKDSSFLKFKKEQIMPFILILLACFISIVPSYVPQYVFLTYTNFILKSFNYVHLAWILFMVLEVTILTFIFRKKSYEDRYILLIILSLTLLIQYNQMFSSLGELTFKRMPFQLCNIGSYLMLITLFTKSERLYQFNLIINVAGGLIAMVVMNVEGKGILYLWNIHYMVEHNNVVVVPILCMLLKMFKPLRKVDFKYFVINFTYYYLFVLIIGTILNGVHQITGNDYFQVNYLFMFMKSQTGAIVPFVDPWFDVQIKMGNFTLFPLVQIAVYLGFVIIGSIIFYVFYRIFKNRKITMINE